MAHAFALASFRAQTSTSQLVPSPWSGTRLTGCAGDRPENVFQGFVILSAVRPVSHPGIPIKEELFALVDAHKGVMLPFFQFWCLTSDLSYKLNELICFDVRAFFKNTSHLYGIGYKVLFFVVAFVDEDNLTFECCKCDTVSQKNKTVRVHGRGYLFQG